MDEATTSAAGARVAVIVPCFDDGATLAETVASLQGTEPIELVVVDDASRDPATLALYERLEADGVRIVYQPVNRGLSAARMAGVAATSAPFIFPLDADDLAVPASITAMADRLAAAPGAAACVGDYEEFGAHDVRRTVPATLDPFRVAYVNEYPVTALFERTALLAAGGWREHARPWYEDWDLWMSLAETGASIVHAGEEVTAYRRRNHGTRMLADVKASHRDVYRQMRELHPRLFADLPAHRRASSVGAVRKALYPILYGGRRRFAFEPALRRALDRRRLWQLGR